MMDEQARKRWIEAIRQKEGVNECCRQEGALEILEDGEKAIARCKTCGRRHFYMRAEMGDLMARRP